LRLLTVSAGLATGLLALIVLFLVRESWPVISRVGVVRFFLDQSWHPTEQSYGLTPMFVGSLATTGGAIVIAAPLGVASAVFCRFYAPEPMARIYRWAIILLAGLPSVVLGLWGLTAVVPLITQLHPPGTSLLAGSIVLALMILPTVALTTEGALASLPPSYWNGAAALGLSREAAILFVVLPAARGSIAAGVALAAGRALGETMAVLMVSGNVVRLPSSVFDPVRTLTANIALEMAYATGDHRASLFASGLLTAALVAVLAAMATRLGGGRTHA
jgi:phosphate transport system permease protein